MPGDLNVGFDSVFVAAPDGKSVVFNASRALWLRSLEDGTVRRLAGTAGGTLPFWSPSSRSSGFFADGHVQRLNLPDGSPSVLAPAPSPRGGAWSSRGVIVFAPSIRPDMRHVCLLGLAIVVVALADQSGMAVGSGAANRMSAGDRPPDNEPPVVTIAQPDSSRQFGWGAQFRYAITVSDREDGESSQPLLTE